MTFARDSWPTLIPTAPSASATQDGWKRSAPSQVFPTSQLGIAAQIVIVCQGFRLTYPRGSCRWISMTLHNEGLFTQDAIWAELFVTLSWCWDYTMSFLANASYTSDKSACKKNRKNKHTQKKSVSPPSSKQGLSVLVSFYSREKKKNKRRQQMYCS